MSGTLKITDSDVNGIRFAKEEGLSLRAIGSLYGISATQVFRILKGIQRNRKTSKKIKFYPLDENRALDFMKRMGITE